MMWLGQIFLFGNRPLRCSAKSSLTLSALHCVHRHPHKTGVGWGGGRYNYVLHVENEGRALFLLLMGGQDSCVASDK